MTDALKKILGGFAGPDEKAAAIMAEVQANPRDYLKPKPLVWVAGDGITTGEDYLTAHDGFGGYYSTQDGQVWHSVIDDIYLECDDEDAAKAAAQAHNDAQLFGGWYDGGEIKR